MTYLTEPNRDAMFAAPDDATTGPLVGFLEAFRVSVDAQMRAASQFGVEYAMHELDWEQTQAMLEAGVEDPPQLKLALEGSRPGEGPQSVAQMLRRDSGYYEDFLPERSADYFDVARRYSGEEVGEQFEERLQAYDARIAQIRRDRPDLNLRSSRGLFSEVQRRAQAAEQREQNDRRTWGGAFGGFFGATLSSLHPGTDPLNFYSLGVGGAGKTAVQRVSAQVGIQGVAETINQATGVQANRDLLGLSSGLGDAATRVLGTAAGAGVVQGLGEAAVAGARRIFRSRPGDPAPDIAPDPPAPLTRETIAEDAQLALQEQNPRSALEQYADRTPLSGIPAARPRVARDVVEMSQRLNDWDGGAPVSIRPRTADAAYTGDVPRTSTLDAQGTLDNARLYAAAKEQDPETFQRYEQLTETKAVYRQWIEQLSQSRDADVQQAMDNIDATLDALAVQLRSAQGKSNKAKLRERMREARQDKEALIRVSEQRETPAMAELRRDLMRTDEKARDLAPLIGRAYARARGRWASTDAEVEAAWQAYQTGRAPDVPDTDTPLELDFSLLDRVPALAEAPEPRATSAETMSAVVAERQKVLDEALDAYRASVGRLLQEGSDGVRVEGSEHVFALTDKLHLEDGEITVRQLLEQQKEADETLEAVSTCSIR